MPDATPSFSDRMAAIRAERDAISATPPDTLVDEASRVLSAPELKGAMDELAMIQSALPGDHPLKFYLNSLVGSYLADVQLVAQNIAQRPKAD